MNGCFANFNDSKWPLKNMRFFQRLKKQVLVSKVNFVKRKRSSSFEITGYLFASHKVNMAYLT